MNYDKPIIQKMIILSIFIFSINYLIAQEIGVVPNLDEIHEIRCENEIGNIIYYTGPYIGIGIQSGVGEYWIYENNIKK
jgi:hypothetical protein